MEHLILFDLDGTLTASHPGIIRCVQHALEKMHYPEVTEQELLSFVGPPLQDQFKAQFHMTDEETQQAIAFFRERFSTVGKFENSVFSGIPEMLQDLQSAGQKTGIASSKAEQFVWDIVRHFHLDAGLDYVTGATMDGSIVEKQDVLRLALQRSGFSDRKERVIMVGDRKYDIEGARAVGIFAVGVSYGYGSREELEQAGADHVCDTVQELRHFLLEVAAQ